MKIGLFFWILLLGLLVSMNSCNSLHSKQRKNLREAEKRKEAAQKEKDKKYEEAVKRHASIQSKSSKNKMKSNYSKAEAYNYNQKPPFYKRWFKSKNKRTKAPEKVE